MTLTGSQLPPPNQSPEQTRQWRAFCSECPDPLLQLSPAAPFTQTPNSEQDTPNGRSECRGARRWGPLLCPLDEGNEIIPKGFAAKRPQQTKPGAAETSAAPSCPSCLGGRAPEAGMSAQYKRRVWPE